MSPSAALLTRNTSSARHRALQTGVREVYTMVEPGDPAKIIIDHAGDVDMIVMGRRGLGPIDGLLQGSVSQKVNQLADAACVTVK